jgi:hypothetical protein
MHALKEQGYSRYDLQKDLAYDGLEKDLAELQAVFDTLPTDSYAPELNRYRRYSRAIIFDKDERMEWLPGIERENGSMAQYFQGRFNPEYVDSYREFPSLPDHILENKLLQKIIMHDYKETFWRQEDLILPVHAGIHFVKLEVTEEGQEGVSSPNLIHQDGEPFTFAHLMKRDNVVGGLNIIATPACAGKLPKDADEKQFHESFEIHQPLESYGVHDEAVSHYVSPIQKGEADRPGVRAILLIDFQPTVLA